MIYDITIIGGGPAAVSAGVYSARKRLSTLFLTSEFGGQSIVSPDIQNWIGTPKISGSDLAKNLETHLKGYEGDILMIKKGEAGFVTSVQKTGDNFSIATKTGETFTSKTVLVATGSNRRKLTVPGADTFDQKGLTYCASCDGPLFADRDVVVIGGGNAGFESAGQLLAYCKSVTLLHKNTDFKADKITVDKILSNPKMTAITNVEIVEITGDKFVTGLVYKNKETGENVSLKTDGIFVEIGFVPNTSFVKDLVDTDNFGAIKINPLTQATSLPGIWSAGDCTNVLYHQNNIAAGDGVKAIEDIYNHLHLK